MRIDTYIFLGKNRYITYLLAVLNHHTLFI